MYGSLITNKAESSLGCPEFVLFYWVVPRLGVFLCHTGVTRSWSPDTVPCESFLR